VIQLNERARFLGFSDPGLTGIRGHEGLYVARDSDADNPLWKGTGAKRTTLGHVGRTWRGIVMGRYVLQTISNWTPDLTPAPDTPFYRVHPLADAGARPGAAR